MTDKAVSMKLPGGDFDYPVLDGTVGPEVVDIRKFYAETGMFTYDPGFTSTASCESAITYIDGEKGVLLHRGYPIDQLAEKSDFLEVAYLLEYGELPNVAQKQEWVKNIKNPRRCRSPGKGGPEGLRKVAKLDAVRLGDFADACL